MSILLLDYFISIYLGTGSYVDQVSHKLTVADNDPFLLLLPGAGISGVHHHTYLWKL